MYAPSFPLEAPAQAVVAPPGTQPELLTKTEQVGGKAPRGRGAHAHEPRSTHVDALM
jgi:hypothetical protein